DGDEARLAQRRAEQRHAKQLLLGDHAQGPRERIEEDGHVEVTLVIRHEHARLAARQELEPDDFDLDLRVVDDVVRPLIEQLIGSLDGKAAARVVSKRQCRRFESSIERVCRREEAGAHARDYTREKRRVQAASATPLASRRAANPIWWGPPCTRNSAAPAA